ncbi:MAG: hypothetical protein IIT46_13855, partial [Lachnospiraceae bacterium]|nr:hypothetical protein [Lachnospiraceae bacterium]
MVVPFFSTSHYALSGRTPSKPNTGSYNNFYWQANIAQRPVNLDVGASDQNYRAPASVQGLVDSTLTDGLVSQN